MSTQTTTPARERILNTAKDLFYEEGIRAVGVDKIIERSGIAKMTLYRHFPGKDDLVVAYLHELDRGHWEWFDSAIAGHPGAPRQQLLDLFDALVEKLSVPEYRGCAFSNVVTEFPDPKHPGRQVALEHTRRVRERLSELAREAGARDPAQLGDQLALLMDGAYVFGQKSGGEFAARHARDVAAALIAAQIPERQA